MKRLLAIAALVAATAAHADIITDTAQVQSVNPVYQNISRQSCQQVPVQVQGTSGERGMGGSIIGGIAGALLLGSQVGGGNGNKAAIAAGAITGTVVGDRVQNDGTAQAATVTRMETRCTSISTPQIIGYDVSYTYNGKSGTTRMLRDPGATIRVTITPAE